jgi:3-deoxy-D-manno-octulosonic-acid transferase
VFRDGRYRRGLGERFGALPRDIFGTRPGGIWLHAVSVGEVLSAVALLRELKARLPETPVWVSVATLAGRDLAEDRLRGLAAGIFFAPVDMVWIVRRVLRRLRPALHINLETELWPNRLRELQRAGVRVMQANARISDKAWPSYERLAALWGPVLGHIDWLGAQGESDAARFRALGYRGPLEEVGNLKFDFNPAGKALAAELAGLLESWRDRPLLIAASTVADDIEEEDVVLDAFAALGNQVRLVLAPRKPERFALVAEKLRARGVAFVQRSSYAGVRALGNVLLLDTLGEMVALFPYASVVFVGGSLCRWGGHNILEPAYFGKAILTGPHMQNFAEIQKKFLAADAVEVVSAANLAERVLALAQDDGGMGARAQELADSLRGVAGRLAEKAATQLEQGLPHSRLPGAGLTWPLAGLWRVGATWKATPRRLPAAVISVGNLSMGGTGKTPVTLALAEAFRARGKRVGILTRGYGRRERGNRIVLPGERASVDETGDEAQLYLAGGQYALGVGADRYAVGRELLDRFDANVLLLDDGFQHRRLHRDFDLVLVDAAWPFPGLDVPPVGLLREPLEALGRADAILLTRTERGRGYARLRRLLPEGTAVFEAEEELTLSREVDPEDALAFCGLGNPGSFRLSLERLGLGTLPLRSFSDHHAYTRAEQEALRLEAHWLVTTAKDAAKWERREELAIVEQRYRLPEGLLEKAFLAAEGGDGEGDADIVVFLGADIDGSILNGETATVRVVGDLSVRKRQPPDPVIVCRKKSRRPAPAAFASIADESAELIRLRGQYRARVDVGVAARDEPLIDAAIDGERGVGDLTAQGIVVRAVLDRGAGKGHEAHGTGDGGVIAPLIEEGER